MLRDDVLDVARRIEPGQQFQGLRFRRVLPFTRAVQDAILVYAALALAYWARYGLKLGPAVGDSTPFSGYQRVSLILLVVMMLTLLVKGAYRTRLTTEIADEIITIFSAATITVASILVVTFMLHQFEYSRAVMVYLWVFLVALLAFGRALARSFQSMCHRRGWGIRRLLVVGASDTAKMIMQSVMNRPDLGYEVVGFVEHHEPPHGRDFGRFRALGTVEDLPDVIACQGVDEVVVALPASAHKYMWSIVGLCERLGVGLKLVPDLFEVSLSRVQVDDIAGVPLLDVREQPLHRVARTMKRSMDVVIASLALLMSLPVLSALALLIVVDSDGPAFIRQERVGLNGRRFTCFKLRTMRTDADQLLPALRALNETTGPIFKMRRDPRVTRIGRSIRRWSLDEVPQLWNVLRGDMSLVGPRPPLPSEVEKYDRWQMRRLEAKPGLTGLWQVSGRSDLHFDEMVMMDVMYVDNWSLALDLKILMRTFIAVVVARGAY